MIPVIVAAAATLYDQNVWIPPTVLIEQVIEKQFLPLLIGIALMYFAPGLSVKARPILNMSASLCCTPSW